MSEVGLPQAREGGILAPVGEPQSTVIQMTPAPMFSAPGVVRFAEPQQWSSHPETGVPVLSVNPRWAFLEAQIGQEPLTPAVVMEPMEPVAVGLSSSRTLAMPPWG